MSGGLASLRADDPRAPRVVPRAPKPPCLEETIVTLTAPASLEADQYRLLRWEVERLRASRGISVVAFTSPGIGEGKTTTALNLAGTLSCDPATRVLVVDADLRRPAAGLRLGVEAARQGPGLAGLLADPSLPLESATRSVPPHRLLLLPAGQPEGGTYELLRSPRLGELLGQARARFDFVIVDTPPLLVLPDCKALTPWVDGFLLVVAAHRTPRHAVGSALSALREDTTLGIVLNRADQPRAAYYRHYYGASRGNGKGSASTRRARP